MEPMKTAPITKLTEEQKAAYLANGANCCPACESCDISGGHVEIAGMSAYQEVSCNECRAVWQDGYTLTTVYEMEWPEPSEAADKQVVEPHEVTP